MPFTTTPNNNNNLPQNNIHLRCCKRKQMNLVCWAKAQSALKTQNDSGTSSGSSGR